MKHRLMHVSFCIMILAAAAAAEGTNRRTMRSKQEADKKVDVCKLLTSAEIEGVQGERVEEAKPSAQSSGGLLMSQCLFRTPTPAKSVSLALAAPSAQKPRDYWRKQFHSAAEKEEHKDDPAKASKKPSREAGEGEGSKPRAIRDVGEEAYWVGGPITGALYVLRGNNFIRVSVGGVREEPARIEKSVALARAALKRL
jgi:hypothetical protein